MEFKYHAIDNVRPPTTLPSLSPVTYLPSLQMNGGFSGFQSPLTGEEALRRELEKEVIRREMLRRMELEEEVRRELAIERELGISLPRPMNIQRLVSQWSNSTAMNPVAVDDISVSQPPLILPPTEINPSPEMSDNDKVIVLAKPDSELFYAKRKATTLTVSETEPSALNLKKKQKQEWSCNLCEIKATSKSSLNAHLNGKKHKIMEARQNKICKNNKESDNFVKVKATKTMDTISENEPKNEDQRVETMDENDVSINYGNEKEALEMMVDKNATKCENEELDIEKGQCLESVQETQESI